MSTATLTPDKTLTNGNGAHIEATGGAAVIIAEQTANKNAKLSAMAVILRQQANFLKSIANACTILMKEKQDKPGVEVTWKRGKVTLTVKPLDMTNVTLNVKAVTPLNALFVPVSDDFTGLREDKQVTPDMITACRALLEEGMSAAHEYPELVQAVEATSKRKFADVAKEVKASIVTIEQYKRALQSEKEEVAERKNEETRKMRTEYKASFTL